MSTKPTHNRGQNIPKPRPSTPQEPNITVGHTIPRPAPPKGPPPSEK
jgi:hypothetical protein